MKTIILNFDDARSDFYLRAFPIMKQYGIPSTVYVISRYMSDMPGHEYRKEKHYIGVSRRELLECYHSGLVEVACHGANHKNNKEDVELNISDLRSMGIDEPIYGFASPGCKITERNKNEKGIWNLVENKQLLYVRSGITIRREGPCFIVLSIIDRYLHSCRLFARLNRHNLITKREQLPKHVLPSITIYAYTQIPQIEYLIDHMPDSSAAILMFHSVLRKGDDGYGYDRFCWDETDFESLCALLKSRSDVHLCMTKDLFVDGSQLPMKRDAYEQND